MGVSGASQKVSLLDDSDGVDVKKPVLLTAALPYANGKLHIGHVVEYTEADIINRFFKLAGASSGYYCASDVHGTPIEVSAQKAGVTADELVEKHHRHNKSVLDRYGVQFTAFSTTGSKENKWLTEWFWSRLLEKGYLYQKEIELSYCDHCTRFLPDRFVKGSCPKCGAPDQYGDACEKCNATYATTDLVAPYCVICSNSSSRKSSEHTFFKLSSFREQLASWLSSCKGLQQDVVNSVNVWINDGLKDWCVSRDAPYYGFNVPGKKDKYLYVWFDAPIGYLASVASTLDPAHPEQAIMKWNSSRVVHVIGKDILYFHMLFWPAVLLGAGLKLPDDIVVHGHLLWNGEKLSKSRGSLIDAGDFLSVVPPELLRFYYAAHLRRSVNDLDFTVDAFLSSVNNDLVANIANFCYRVLSFTMTKLEGKVGVCSVVDEEVHVRVLEHSKKAVHSYSKFELADAVREILEVGSIGNVFIQLNAPWKLLKENPARAGEVLATGVNIVKILAVLLKPILPSYAEALEKQLGLSNLSLSDVTFSYENRSIAEASIVLKPLEPFTVATSDPFSDIDLRVGRIVHVEDHPKADKLFVLKVDLGVAISPGGTSSANGGERQIVAGVRQAYAKEELLNRLVVVVANLKPAVLRGVKSDGMLLAAVKSDGTPVLLHPSKSSVGERVFVDGVKGAPKKEVDIAFFSGLGLRVHKLSPSYKTQSLKTKSEVLVAEAPDGSVVG